MRALLLISLAGLTLPALATNDEDGGDTRDPSSSTETSTEADGSGSEAGDPEADAQEGRPSGADASGPGPTTGGASNDPAPRPKADRVLRATAEDDVIVVTGRGRDESARRAVHRPRVLTREAIARSGAISAADALEQMPGVQISEGIGGEGIRLQGLDPEHVLVMVDGIRLNGRVGGTVDLRRLPASEIEQIEIVEGPSATLYGSDAMAGVVHIRTRRAGDTTRAELSLTAGRFASPARAVDDSVPRATPVPELDTLDATASLANRYRDLRTRLSAGWHTGEASDITPDDPGTAVNAYRQLRLTGTSDLEVSSDHTWSLSGRWTSFRRWGVDALPTGAVLDRTNLTSEWGLLLGPQLALGPSTDLSIEAGGSGWTDQYRVDQRNSDTQDAYQRTQDILGQLRARVDHRVGGHQLAGGVEVLGETLEADRLDPKRVDRARYAAFLQDTWDVLGDATLDVQASARGDIDTRFGTYLTPRLGIRAEPVPEVTLRLSGGRGFRAPDFREMFLIFENAASGYRVEGTEGLRPETSWNTQGSVRWRPTPGLTLGAGGFYNELTDLIQADLIEEAGPGSLQRFGYVNVASARTMGVDLEAELSDTDVGGLLLHWRGLDTLDRTTDLPLSGRSPHQVTAQGHIILPVWDLTLNARGTWFAPRDFVQTLGGAPTVVAAPAVLNADVTVTLRPTEHLSVQAGIENLADAGDTPEALLQTRPRRIFLGITGSLEHRRTPPSKEDP